MININQINQLADCFDKEDYESCSELIETLMSQGQMDYIERTEYAGWLPDIAELQQLDQQFPAEYVPGELITGIVAGFNDLDPFAAMGLVYELPFYEHINYYLAPFNVELASLSAENDYLFLVDQEMKKALEESGANIIFYEPASDDEIKIIMQELHSAMR